MRPPPRKAGRSSTAGGPPREVRIVGGHWKRSKLPVADSPGLRPTPDRVRETLFNWLGQRLDGWRVLDAFAGSGALGFEAASRGAREVLLLEREPKLVRALLAAALATGHFAEWLLLWFLPTRLGVLVLNIFFQWLPHHPFDHSERYLNTRVSLWPGGTFLTLQQNLHLMHHLWPSVPFYNYARLFQRLRPVLKAEGSRIEGLMVGPHRRTIEG